jgi:hypothetical protein
MNQRRTAVVKDWCQYKRREVDGGIVVKVYDNIDLSAIEIDKRFVDKTERTLANLVSYQPFPTYIYSYLLDGCNRLILSDKIQLMYFRRDVLLSQKEHRERISREFKCMTPYDNDSSSNAAAAEKWKKFVHGASFSCHEILVKRESPLRMFFDCECSIQDGMIYTPEDQEQYFNRFIIELPNLANDILMEWGVCSNEDSLDWIRCKASDISQKKLSAHLYLYGSGTCFCQLSDLRALYTACYIQMGDRCAKARAQWSRNDRTVKDKDHLYYLWMSLHLDTLMDVNVYQYGHSIRCYGSMSIKTEQDIGNYKRCILTKPTPDSFDVNTFFNTLIQVPDLSKVKRLVLISKLGNLEQQYSSVFERLHPLLQRAAPPKIQPKTSIREKVGMSEIKDIQARDNLVQYCNKVFKEQMGSGRIIFTGQERFYLMDGGLTIFVEKKGNAFCIREKQNKSRMNITQKSPSEMGYHKNAMVAYYFSPYRVTFKCFKCCKIEENDKDYVPINKQASQHIRHLIESLKH